MADLSTNIPQISFGQADKETAVNELFDAASPSMLFGRNGVTSAGLNFGIFGGRFKGLVIANSVQALTASATSYIEADATTGAVTKNTTGWTTGKLRLYKCVTNATAVTSYEDHRMLAAGTMSNITDKQGKVLDDLTPLLAADVDSAVEPKGYLVSEEGGFFDGSQLFVQQTPEGLVAQTIHVPLLGKSGFRTKPVGGAWSDFAFTIAPFDIVGWHGNTTAEAANAVINADGTFSRSTFDVVAALADKLDADQVGVANGVASLGADGKVPAAQLPDLSITDTFVVADQVAMLALTAQRGDVAVRSDLNRSFILAAEPASTLSHWQELLTPTDAVLSVAGKTGAVTIASNDLTDAGATGKALVQSATAAAAKTALSLTSADVGLGNVDNTSDANKPISTATQTALNAKANTASSAYAGQLAMYTDATGNNSTAAINYSTARYTLPAIDVRDEYPIPYNGVLPINGSRFEFKRKEVTANANGITAASPSPTDTYNTVWIISPWADSTGGMPTQVSLSPNYGKLFIRSANYLATPTTPTWAASTAKSVNNTVHATPANRKTLYFKCSTAGTTGSTEPTWPTTVGDTVTDGSVVWTAYAYWSPWKVIPTADYASTVATQANACIDSNGNIFRSTANMGRFVSPPATSSSTGSVGDWSADASYIYVCYATNTWRRSASSSF